MSQATMIDTGNDLKRTSFYRFHTENGAKLVPFAGYEMPIQFSGMTAEHNAVRENVGLFDLSHMGEFKVSGADAETFLQRLTCNDVGAVEIGQAQYTALLYENGGFVDDLLLYRFADYWLMVVNAANIKKDYRWLESHLTGDVTLENQSDTTELLALQGPNAAKLFQELTDFDLAGIGTYRHAMMNIGGRTALVSRTGYTGEDGFEIYLSPDQSEEVWERIVSAGKAHNLTHIGLGARDSLRLEMKMALYGNDIDETTTALEAGLSWIVKLNSGEFIGREALMKQKQAGIPRKLVCIEFSERCIPRPGYALVDSEGGAEIGTVTSGAFSPTLQKPIALGYLPAGKNKIGITVGVKIRERIYTGQIVKAPFYKNY